MAGNDAYTVLLLHADGTSGSSTFTDSSAGTHNMTAGGTVQIDTTVKRLGTASGKFDGDSDYLSTPDSADWSFGSGDFTIDFWLRMPDTTGNYMLVTSTSAAVTDWQMMYIAGNGVRFFMQNGATTVTAYTSGTGWVNNTWYHVAAVRSSNSWDVYKNGSSGGRVTDADAMPDIPGPLWIGAYEIGTHYYLSGWIDELRISKGIARWSGNFTFPPDINKVASVNTSNINVISSCAGNSINNVLSTRLLTLQPYS